MTRNVWPDIEPHLLEVERPSRYLDHERGIIRNPDASYKIVLIYPDTYEIGQSNLGLAILYHCLNADATIDCERTYLPWDDLAGIMRSEHIPLFALESFEPIADFDMVGFTLPHELAITNVLESLDLAGIPLRSSDRDESSPLVIAGGPCAYNPEPFSAFIDLFVIGEGEYVNLEIAREHRRLRDAGATREEQLLALSKIAGVYVPSLYEPADLTGVESIIKASKTPCRDAWEEDACKEDVEEEDAQLPQGAPEVAPPLMRPVRADVPSVVYKRVVREFDHSPIHTDGIVPYAETTFDRFSFEPLRGCSRGCRFCQAGMIYRPVRERSADTIVSAAINGLLCTGYDEISLTSLSTTDHSQLKEVLRRLNARLADTGIRISIPSQRVDSFGVEVAQLVAGNKKGGLTFAPEAGTQRLRDCINKNVTEEDFLKTIAHAVEAGWRRVKLYFMCGLPTETDEDLRGIGQMVQHALDVSREHMPSGEDGSIKISVACSVFVPKAHTPFQWCPQIAEEEIMRRIGVLRASLPRKGVDFHWHEPKTSFVEAAISRGGREMCDVIEAAWKRGSHFDAWREHFSFENWTAAADESGVDLFDIAGRRYAFSDPLPWTHVSCGVSQRYLALELQRALREVTTPDCTFESCTGCGLCSKLGCSVELAGERDG